jgi:hypothetical protein
MFHVSPVPTLLDLDRYGEPIALESNVKDMPPDAKVRKPKAYVPPDVRTRLQIVAQRLLGIVQLKEVHQVDFMWGWRMERMCAVNEYAQHIKIKDTRAEGSVGLLELIDEFKSKCPIVVKKKSVPKWKFHNSHLWE